jgi:CRISPR system Cascade subunit CasA
MPLNLISDPWIPVLRRDRARDVIAPWQMADATLQRPDWPRADLNLACLELLIGLVALADPPAGLQDWRARQSPDPDRLRERLAPYAPAFNLTGDGPRFLQDLSPLEGEPNPPDMLFIDSAGGNTAKNNADLMVRRDRYPSLPLPLAAMALFAFQAMAPSGGAGNRTSMRGGGPLSTLVDPGQGLWPLVWANVPDGTPAPIAALPWMRETVVSDKGAVVTPQATHPVEALFGMPRRLRLVVEGDTVTGVVQRPWGTNYAGWVHPLTPYYRMKAGAELLPKHPSAGPFGYRNWLGVVADGDTATRQRATMVGVWGIRSPQADAQLMVGGWAMDNMKPRDFTLSVVPLVSLSPAAEVVLRGMVGAADAVAVALRGALADVLAEGEGREALREEFYIRTQTPFDAAVAQLTAVNTPEDVAKVAESWWATITATALTLFDSVALPGLPDRDLRQQQAIVAARSRLVAMRAGRGKAAQVARGLMLLDPVEA